MTSLLRSYKEYDYNSRPLTGDTKTSLIDIDHQGWLKCDGRTVSVADYPNLFAIIGHSFGGSGDNFLLPNPTGRVVGITGNNGTTNLSGSTTNWQSGDVFGEQCHILIVDEIPAHNHTGMTGISGDHTHTTNATGGATGPGLTINSTGGNNTANNHDQSIGELDLLADPIALTINSAGSHSHTISSQGGGLAHNNMQPTLFVGNLFVYSGKLYINQNGYTLRSN